MSSDAPQPPTKPSGIINVVSAAKLKRSSLVRQAPPELLSLKKPPTSITQPAVQSFQGDAPSKPAVVKPVSSKPAVLPVVPAPVQQTTLRHLAPKKPTKDYRPRTRVVDLVDQEEFNRDLPKVMTDFQKKQTEIESASPYLTDHTIYTPQSRKSFYRFITEHYSDVFRLLPQVKGKIDEQACQKLEQAAGTVVEGFLYQKFIREYIRNAGPYRGMLVYHGLGSGKTCSAIAAAEALYGTSNKKIIVMTPFSLRGNFMSEISFCGFRHFNVHNHWVSQPLDSSADLVASYAKSVLSLPDAFLKKVRARPESQRRTIWVADFKKEPNYNSLDQQSRDDIREQLTAMIDARIKFISYNGITAAELKRYACQVDPVTGERFFDNAVVVIDEFHNLTRLMQGQILPYIVQRKGRARKIPAEPIEPGKWKPGLCNTPMNYKRAYLFYKILTDARNSKIIALSGTPIINFPEELGIMANILAGYTECAEVTLQTADKKTMNLFKEIAEREPRVDIVRFRAGDRTMSVLISVFNEGYQRVPDPSGENRFIGVKYNEKAQEGIREVYARIKVALKEAKIPIGEEIYVSHPRLPIDDESFKQNFIDPNDLSIINKVVLQKRLTGLISYYKGSKEEYMPKVIKDEIVKCDMSDYVLSKYTTERKREIEGEVGKEKEPGDIFSAVEVFAKMKNPSSYRFRSRALCNFAFPKSIERPFPTTRSEEVELEKEVEVVSEDVEVSEMVANSDVDKEALKLVEEEEAMMEDPESDEFAPAAEPSQQGGAESESESDESESESDEIQSISDVSTDDEQQWGGADEEVPPAPVPVRMKIKRPVAGPVAPVASEPAVAEPVAPAPVAEAPVAEAPKKVTIRRPRVGPTNALRSEPEPVQPSIPRVLTYQERVARAMKTLDTDRDLYMNLDDPIPEKRLDHYSPKLDHMLRRINASNGSNLVYSQFKTVEGLGVLGVALRANGYVELQITGSDQAPQFSPATIASLQKGPQSGEKRFITFTGEGSKERRTLVLNVFNGNLDKLPPVMRQYLEPYAERRNNYGEICWVIGITGAGAEGISLKCCRSVHIMEPYWNNVRLDQVKGRAIRICSHKDLPFNERNVEIYTYYTVFSARQKQSEMIDRTIRTMDMNETSDEKVFNVSIRKDLINRNILEIMKESAVDCGLNAADNDGIQCFVVDGKPDQYLFDPDLEVDKIITSMELKEDTSSRKFAASVADSVDAAKDAAPHKMYMKIVSIKGTEYMLRPKADAGGSVLELFARADMDFRKALGEVMVDPMTEKFSRLRFY